VAVFGGDNRSERALEQLVDDGDDLAAVLDGECAVLLSLVEV
jgi:hypothetical protein